MTIADPEAPGRGPAKLGMWYRWEREGDLPLMGTFAGFVLGTRKGADTLFVKVGDQAHVGIRYEYLERAIRAEQCPQCDAYLLRSLDGDWSCVSCDYVRQR